MYACVLVCSCWACSWAVTLFALLAVLLVQVAVLSATLQGSLQPFCVYSGDFKAHIATWLLAHNVTLIKHELTWRQKLVEKSKTERKVG